MCSIITPLFESLVKSGGCKGGAEAPSVAVSMQGKTTPPSGDCAPLQLEPSETTVAPLVCVQMEGAVAVQAQETCTPGTFWLDGPEVMTGGLRGSGRRLSPPLTGARAL